MAPEVLCSQNHSYPVDFFALGVICYEFMLGKRPYHGKGRKEVKQDIISHQVKVTKEEIPIGWCLEAADFINGLIQRKVEKRLGNNGIEELKNHPWFKNFDWKNLFAKKMITPFIPKKGDNYNKKYCEADDKLGDKTLERYQQYKNEQGYNQLFENYTFNNIPREEIKNYTKKKDQNKIIFKNNILNTPEDSTFKKLSFSKSSMISNTHNIIGKKLEIPQTFKNSSNTFRKSLIDGKFTKIKFFNGSKQVFLQNNLNKNEVSFFDKKISKKSNLPIINLNTSRALKKSISASNLSSTTLYQNNINVNDKLPFSSKLYFINRINSIHPYQKYPINIEQPRLMRSTSNIIYTPNFSVKE